MNKDSGERVYVLGHEYVTAWELWLCGVMKIVLVRSASEPVSHVLPAEIVLL